MSIDSHSQWNGLIERIKSHWSQAGVRQRPGVSAADIELFESSHRVCIPMDMREFFTTIDGMDDYEIDNDGFSFHRLQAVKSVPEELADFGGIPDYRQIVTTLPQPASWFVLADFLIYSAVFAIRLSAVRDNTPVLWIGDGTTHNVVANSFSSFLDCYLTAPYELSGGAIGLS